MAKRNLFAELTQGLDDYRDYRDGKKGLVTKELATPDVKAIREILGVSQAQFAELVAVKLATLQNWEQKRRQPTGATRVLLHVLEQDPEAIIRMIHPGLLKESSNSRTRPT